MDKKKIGIIAIIVSAVIHVCLLVFQISKAVSILHNSSDFDLYPLMWIVLILLLLLGHVGLYVMIMDYQEKTMFVNDEYEWWKKWDEA